MSIFEKGKRTETEDIITSFVQEERKKEEDRRYDDMRMIGYALDITFDTVTVITSDAFKVQVGGVPKNAFLVMAPTASKAMSHPDHLIVLRVREATATPLSQDVQKTFFEMQKRAMPELDQFTQVELQWSALRTDLLGVLYSDADGQSVFAGDIPGFVSPHKYRVYAPTDRVLRLLLNFAQFGNPTAFPLGVYRPTECILNGEGSTVEVLVDASDFKGQRCALFGKTRLGKSNTVKLIAASMLEKESNEVAQLIFDTNGEYANSNEQNVSLKEAYPDRCVVYALKPKAKTPSKPLKLNFFETPDQAREILRKFLETAGRSSGYIESALSVEIPNPTEVVALVRGSPKSHAARKVALFWAILAEAGYELPKTIDADIVKLGLSFTKDVHPSLGTVTDLASLQAALKILADLNNESRIPHPKEKGKNYLDNEESALLAFLHPKSGLGLGTKVLMRYKHYHSASAKDFIAEVKNELKARKTVIVDLGSADTELASYYTQMLSNGIFQMHEELFADDEATFRKFFTQIYFEEAHNFFPRTESKDVPKVYTRFMKEGAKFHLGITYSTQSPATVHPELLAQTENFFVAHLASESETNALEKAVGAYKGLGADLIRTRHRGFIRMMTASHRFVIPCQVKKFEAERSVSAPIPV